MKPGRERAGLAQLRNLPNAVVLIWRASPALASGYAASILAGAGVPALTTGLSKNLVDDVAAPGASTRSAVPTAVALGMVGAIALLLSPVARLLVNEIGRRVALRGVRELYEAVDRFTGIAALEQPAMQDRIQYAQEGARNFGQFAGDLSSLTTGVLAPLGLIGVLLSISPLIAATVLLAVVPALSAQMALARRRARGAAEMAPLQRREYAFARLLVDSSAGKESRVFGSGPFLRGRMLGAREAVNTLQRRLDLREARVQLALATLSGAITVTGLALVVSSAQHGRLTAGDVSVFAVAITTLLGALSSAVQGAAGVQQRLIVFGDYRRLVADAADQGQATGAIETARLSDAIELRDVWFRYADDQPWVLKGVDLRIPAGESLGLVGLNGAGKSTLIKLICRLYEPVRGSVLWDGVDVRRMDPRALRRRISAVFQDHVQYDLTAAENIALREVDPASNDGESIREAARRGGAHNALERLPRGYDTMLTRIFTSRSDKEDPGTGVMLSGGQWQAVALARAFLREDVGLMILDEPSTGLDAEAEYAVQQRMLSLRRGRSSIVISHRLSVMRAMDAVAVVEGGVVVEYGRHEELMGLDGRYARLFRTQAAGYVDSAALESREPA
ncbi:ABC transporter ATP-binding protein [Actinospica robiniae]|uniref:ABC transporter ATP-binding protein n=1 Tax=Actinospica robiniae TaxID=304901 RepID=UPI000429F417|nr:ABC transporter ATP-binding protein [Actinospica robiniae]